MRLLLVHADRAGFEATREAGPDAETPSPDSASAGTCLVAFAAVETGDGADPATTGHDGAAAVREAADRLGLDRVLVVPCGHLVDDPADPAVTGATLDALADDLPDYAVTRGPAGWNLAVDVDARGHPNAVTARRVGPGGSDGVEGRADREWSVLAPDGHRRPLDPPPDRPALRAVFDRECGGQPRADDSLVARLLADTGLAEAAPGSPGGRRRLLPRGTLVRDALLHDVTNRLAAHGSVPVETPATLDLDEAWVRAALRCTPRRIDGGGPTALRPSARPGHLSTLRDVPRPNLPAGVYEVGPAFPPEPPGNPGSDDAVTVPELTVACPDRASAWTEFERTATLARDATTDLGLSPETVLSVSREVRDENPELTGRLAADFDRPVLLAVHESPRPAARLELFAVADDRPIALSTVELDADPAWPSGDADATVVHCAPVGTVENALAAVVAAGGGRDPPLLPVRLSPTQVRLIPVADAHCGRCDDLAASLEREGVRADVDDRERTVGERIARAERDWVPFYAVVGTDDDAGSLSVADRRSGRELATSISGVVERVRSAVGDGPTPANHLPTRLSDRVLERTANHE